MNYTNKEIADKLNKAIDLINKLQQEIEALKVHWHHPRGDGNTSEPHVENPPQNPDAITLPRWTITSNGSISVIDSVNRTGRGR